MSKKITITAAIIAAILICILFKPVLAGQLNSYTMQEEQLEEIRISSQGRRYTLNVYKTDEGKVLIPIHDDSVSRFLNNFDARITWLVPLKTVVLGVTGGRDFRVKIGENKGEFGGKAFPLSHPAKIINDIPCVPLECFEAAYNFKAFLCKETGVYFMDPIIDDIYFKEEKGKLQLVVHGAHPLKYETSKLESPDRFVIDIHNAVLNEELTQKDIRYRRAGSVFVSQYSTAPNIVRLILTMNLMEIEMDRENKDEKKIIANLFFPQAAAYVQGLKLERITSFSVEKEKDRVVILIRSTGPVQYEWRRLLPPDNRYFIDIPHAKLWEEKIKTLNTGYISSASITQIQTRPEPVARVTLNLDMPCSVSVEPDEKDPRVIRVEVLKAEVNPEVVERQGFGITRFAVQGGVVICIDPGHGGSDPGACHHGMRESDLNLDIALRLRALLQKAGWNVIMTRTTDRDVSFAGSSDSRELGDRANIANSMNAQIFVSIHNNASTSPSQNGTSTHYYKDIDLPLAQVLHSHIVSAIRLRDNGVRRDGFFVARHTRMPAALLELGFMSNPSDAAFLGNPQFRQRCAEGIFNGLMAYAKMRNLGNTRADMLPPDVHKVIEERKQEAIREIEQTKPMADPDFSER